MIESLEFIYILVDLQRSLLYIKEASVKLQGKEQDITSGLNLIEQCCSELKTLRQKVSDYLAHIYAHNSRLAEVSKISISMPRISQRQQHRANQPYHSVEEYFRHSVTIPFLDHLISELSLRFDEHTKKAALVQHLLPVRIRSSSSVQDIEQAVAFYGDDLPNRNIVDEEYERWKAKWISIPSQDRPQSLSDSLRQCCSTSLPNIFTLLINSLLLCL